MTSTRPDYWQRQSADEPLFPDLSWSRPENRAHAGKLLIVGGHSHGFSAPAEAFGKAETAGVGTARVLLPSSLQRMVSKLFPAAEYASSTPSGSFGHQAVAELLDAAAWSDGVLLAGDFGRNSETAILFEKFTAKYSGRITASQDSVDYCISTPEIVLQRPDTLLVLSFGQAQKLFVSAHFPQALTSEMDFLRLIEALHDFTSQHPLMLVLDHLDTTFVAVNGQVSSTKHDQQKRSSVDIAPAAATWWLQNPSRPFEAITTGVFDAMHG